MFQAVRNDAMVTYRSEIHRELDQVEIIETLDLEYQITESEYKSSHHVSGEIRATMFPDAEVRRAREHPPKSVPERVVSSVTGVDSLSLATGYPGTRFYVGLVREPPVGRDDSQFREGTAAQMFSVEGVPQNDTIELGKQWTLSEVDAALAEDTFKTSSWAYDITQYPSEQLPLVIRASIHRDAREYLEKEIEDSLPTDATRDERKEQKRVARQYEGYAVLSIELEYRSTSAEFDTPTDRMLTVEEFRVELESTFNDIEILDEHRRSGDYTYNPERKRIEWRNSYAQSGQTINYDIVGSMSDLVDIGDIQATFWGEIQGETLTGTQIEGLYDMSGRQFHDPRRVRNAVDTETRHTIRTTGSIEIDPSALADEATVHTTAELEFREHPEEAFDKLETVCQQEGITILDIENPGDAEPVRGREGVFEITAGEQDDADDRAGRMEIKREFGDEGIVYANVTVTGMFTTMSKRSEVSAVDETEDRVIRTDEGGLDTRGKATIEIIARSASSELNTELINKVERGFRGVGSRRWDSARDSEEEWSPDQQEELSTPEMGELPEGEQPSTADSGGQGNTGGQTDE